MMLGRMLHGVKHRIPLALALLATMAACADNEPVDAVSDPREANASHESGHGAATSLGTVTVAANQFEIVRLGEFVPESGRHPSQRIGQRRGDRAGLPLPCHARS